MANYATFGVDVYDPSGLAQRDLERNDDFSRAFEKYMHHRAKHEKNDGKDAYVPYENPKVGF